MKRNFIKFSYIILFLLFISGTLAAESLNNSEANSWADWSMNRIDNKIVVNVDIKNNYYLYRDTTSVKLKSINGEVIDVKIKPKATEKKYDYGIQYIYQTGKHEWIFNVSKISDYILNVKYQGCSAKPYACYPPKSFNKTINIGGNSTTLQEGNSDTVLSKKVSSETELITQETSADVDKSFFNSLVHKGGIWVFIVALLGGLFSVFSPCVLPLLPITVAVLGAGKDAKKSQAIKRSLLYVVGIVLTFSVLATIAALTGSAFGGAILSHPIILLIFAIFFIIMSFSLLGMYHFQLPSSWNHFLNNIGGGTDIGAFLMGLVAGFIAIPCTGPVLATLLGIAAVSGNVFFGFALLFVYAVGFGIPFFIVGVGLAKAPKAGAYMDMIKSLLGIVVLILALYLLTIVFPYINTFLVIPSFSAKIAAITLVIIGVLFGAFHGDIYSANKMVKYFKLIGAILVSVGIVWTVKIPVGSLGEKLSWNLKVKESFNQAQTFNKPLIMDFTADWCAACKELEAVTFADKKVEINLKNNWILTKVDATRSSKALKEVEKKYKIIGYPTLIYFSPEGTELFRTTGFVAPEKFINILKKYERLSNGT